MEIPQDALVFDRVFENEQNRPKFVFGLLMKRCGRNKTYGTRF